MNVFSTEVLGNGNSKSNSNGSRGYTLMLRLRAERRKWANMAHRLTKQNLKHSELTERLIGIYFEV